MNLKLDRAADRELTPAPDEAPGDLPTVKRIIEESDVSVMITTPQGVIAFVNPAFERHSGYAANEAVGRTPDLLKSGAHSPEFFSGLHQTIRDGNVFRAVFTCRRKNGDLYHEDKMVTPIRDADEEISHYVSVGRLLTSPQRAKDLAAGPGNYDELTGVANRRSLMDQLTQAIQRCQRDSRRFSLLHVDVDRFKRINDTLGHTTGDRVLAVVARRIAALVGESDIVARPGGDEFTIILEHPESRDTGNRVADALIRACSLPFKIDDRTLYAGISIGIATYPKDGQDIDSLLRHAEIAMYQAKSAGRGRCVNFVAQMEKKCSTICRSKRRCAAPSPTTNSRFSTSRSSAPAMAGRSRLKPCCAGIRRSMARSRRRALSRCSRKSG